MRRMNGGGPVRLEGCDNSGAIPFMAVDSLLEVARPTLRNVRVQRPGQSNTPEMAQSANSSSDMPSTSPST